MRRAAGGDGEKKPEGGGQKEIRSQRSEAGDQKTEDGEQQERQTAKLSVGGWRSGPAGLEVGGKDQRTDDRGRRAERNQKSEVGSRRSQD